MTDLTTLESQIIADIAAAGDEGALEAVREARLAKFGPHESKLPGWRPRWARRREEALRK